MTIATYAKATVTVEFLVGGGGWGPECKIQQVYDQAREAAEGRIRKYFTPQDMKILDIKINSISTERAP